jgi:hypothetical protein
MTRAERHAKRLVIVLIMTIILLFISNGCWLYAWTQYDYSGTETISVDGKYGNANYIGNDGDIINGEDSGQKDSEANQEEWEVQRNENSEE